MPRGTVQFVSQKTASLSHLDTIRLALEGGCRWVQLRMKDESQEQIVSTAIKVRELCDQYAATFIIDDHVELVEQCHADGVHLGQHDMPVSEARKNLGNATMARIMWGWGLSGLQPPKKISARYLA